MARVFNKRTRFLTLERRWGNEGGHGPNPCGGRGGDGESGPVAAIAEGAMVGCDVVVLPECLDLGWTHPSVFTQAETIPGPRSDRICQAAAEHRVFVVAGLTERRGDEIYNTAILVDSSGNLVATHRKINILDIAANLYSPGETLHVSETPWGVVGVLICADNFPEKTALGEALYHMGARAILSPCAWAVPPDFNQEKTPYGDLWRGSYCSLTRDRDLTVIGVSNVGPVSGGPWEGHHCIGNSMAIGTNGKEIAVLPFGHSAECIRIITCPMGSPRGAQKARRFTKIN